MKKRMLSLLLALCMLLTMLPMQAMAAGDTDVYLKPNDNWKSDGARFAVYYFNSVNNTNGWVSMYDAEGDGIYKATIPADNDKMIFCRMNGSNQTNDWAYRWNQSDDLDVPSDATLYVMGYETWGKNEKNQGTWSAQTEIPTDYYLVGNINGADYGCEADAANMGIYRFKDGKLTATFETESFVFLKTTDNRDWYMAKGYDESLTSVTLYNTKADFEGANKLFVPAGVEANFEMRVNLSDDTITLGYTITTCSVSFNAGEGSGSMTGATVNKYAQYELPACDFTAPEGKQFKAWNVDGAEYAVGAFITVNDDTAVTAVWENVPATTYTVTATASPAEGGTVSGDGTYKENTSVTVTATANEGYTFIGWYDGETSVSTDVEYTFTATENRTLTAQFEVAPPAEGDTFIVDGIVYKILSGGETVTAVGMEEGNTITELVIPDTVTNAGKEYSVVSIEKQAFANNANLISVTIGDNVTTIGNQAFYGCTALESLEIGSGVTTIGNYAFYRCGSLTTVTYLGTSEPSSGNGVFGGTTVEVVDVPAGYESDTFCGLPVRKPAYNVTVSETENGTVTGAGEYEVGKEVTLTVTPDEGYVLDTLTVDGNDVTNEVSEGKYTFNMPADTVAVSATFKTVPVTLTLTLDREVYSYVHPEAKMTVAFSGAPGQGKVYLYIDGQSIPDELSYYDGTSVSAGINFSRYTLFTGNHTICADYVPNDAPQSSFRSNEVEFYFEAKNYSVTIDSSIVGGSVTADKTTAPEGAQIRLTVTPEEGFVFDSFTVTDDIKPVQVGDNEYVFNMPAGDVVVTASFAAETKRHTVTFNYNDDAAESIPVSVEDGQPIAKPADPTWTGHSFQGWYGENGQLYDFATPVTGDITLTAKWVLSTHRINVVSSLEGVTAKSDPEFVDYGQAAEATISVYPKYAATHKIVSIDKVFRSTEAEDITDQCTINGATVTFPSGVITADIIVNATVAPKNFVASLTVNGVVTNYTTLDGAISAAELCTKEDKAVVTLLDDIDLGSNPQQIDSGVFTIDLNGKNLSNQGTWGGVLYILGGTITIESQTGGSISGTASGIFINGSSVDLTITGGEISSENKNGISNHGGKVTINGGTISTKKECGLFSGGTAIITGGTIDSEGRFGVAVQDGGTLTVTGGSISGPECDLYFSSGSISLALPEGGTTGATFPGGIKVQNITLNEILDEDAAYGQNGSIVKPAADAKEIAGGDVIVAASYTVTWTVDGETFATTQAIFGGAIPVPEDTPQKTGYAFTGWVDVPKTMPNKDNLTIEAGFQANTYQITFDTDGGSEIEPITQAYGTTVTAPADPTKEGYTFAGWDKEIPATMPAENVTIKANWTVNSYKVTFAVNGEDYKEVVFAYGEKVVAPEYEVPAGHTFSGWTIPETMPAENITLDATLTINQYAITWKDDQGNTLYTEDLYYGSMPAFDAEQSDKELSKACHILSWSPEIVVVTENATYTAVWTLDHSGETEVRDAREATCTEAGYTGDTYCLGCGEKLKDGETITAPGHSHGTEWESDEKQHWHECGCGDKADIADHTGGEATCKEPAQCKICGEAYGDTDPENHTGETEIRDAKEATDTEDGYTGDTYCLDCGALLQKGEVIPATKPSVPSTPVKPLWKIWLEKWHEKWHDGCDKVECDHEYTDEVVEPTCCQKGYTVHTCGKCGFKYCDTYTEALGHAWDAGEVTREASCTENGEKTYTCEVCGETRTEVICATGHDYEDGTCTHCGEAEKPCKPIIWPFFWRWLWKAK